MKQQCIHAVQQAIGRSLTQEQIKDIEGRIRRNQRQLAQADPAGWQQKTASERLTEWANAAAKELHAEAAKKKQRVALTILAHDRVQNVLAQFPGDPLKGLDRLLAFASDYPGIMSIESSSRAIRDEAMSTMLDAIEMTRGRFLSLFADEAKARALVKELHGEDSGLAEAKVGAHQFSEVTNRLRERFNRAGGDVGYLDDWAIPRSHSQMKVARAKDEWIADHVQWAKRSKYFKEDGTPMNDSELTEFITNAWETDLKTANEAYNLLARIQVNDQKAVEESERAGNDLEALVASDGEEVTDAMIKRVEDAIQVQRKLRDTANAKVEAMSERLDLIASAEQKAEDAAAHHADVKAWTLIADLLAPDGIPSEILAGALKPFNESLAKTSTMTTWKKVQIGADMSITAGGRLYTLLSESERWRADTLLALAIAEHSGLKFVILDRFDVLDLPGRGQLFGMLVKMAKASTIDSAIVCGTLKEKPAKLPPEINAVWIENGVAVGTEQLQQAS